MYPFVANITATEATSSTEPKCPIGIRSGFALRLLVTMSVSIRAGAMAFTVLPSRTNALAQEWVSPMVPAFEAGVVRSAADRTARLSRAGFGRTNGQTL